VHWPGLSTAEQKTWEYGTNDDAPRCTGTGYTGTSRIILALVSTNCGDVAAEEKLTASSCRGCESCFRFLYCSPDSDDKDHAPVSSLVVHQQSRFVYVCTGGQTDTSRGDARARRGKGRGRRRIVWLGGRGQPTPPALG
jgi:hypothetical protein